MYIKTQIKRLVTSMIVFVFVSIPSVQAQENPLAGLDDYVKKSMQQWEVPGVAVAIVKDDKVVFAKGYGTRTVGKNQPVDENTLFAIGSQTKTFTATALAMLVDEGEIQWDDLMLERLPGFQVGDSLVTSQTTIRDALSNRTGVQGGFLEFRSRPSLSRKEVLGLMKHLDSVKDFRAGYEYNNFMFLAAGEVITAVTGSTWDNFIADKIFRPLNMKSSKTGYVAMQASRNRNIATPHVMSDDKAVPIPHGNIDNAGPAGSIYSSAKDMAQWLRFHLNNGKVDGKVIISEGALLDTRKIENPKMDEMLEILKMSNLSDNFVGYGLGIMISDSAGYRVYSHSGHIDGMISNFVFVPELNLGVVVLVNSKIWLAPPLTGWILDRYTGVEQTDYVDLTLKKVKEYYEAKNQEKLKLMKSAAIKDTSTSLPLERYAGTYSNELMGDFTILVKKGKLFYSFGEGFEGEIDHLNFDVFLTYLTKPLAWTHGENGVLQFNLDLDGSIKSVLMSDRIYKKIKHE